MHRQRFALAIGGVLVLGACSDGGTVGRPTNGPGVPSASGSLTSTSTTAATRTGTTASTTTTAMEATSRGTTDLNVPAAARVNTDAGAEAFVKYYVEQLNRAWTVPDPDALVPLSLPSCKTCASFTESAIKFRKLNRHYVGVPIAISRVTLNSRADAEHVFVGIIGVQANPRVVDSKGSTVETGETVSVDLEFELHFASGWKAAAVRVAK